MQDIDGSIPVGLLDIAGGDDPEVLMGLIVLTVSDPRRRDRLALEDELASKR